MFKMEINKHKSEAIGLDTKERTIKHGPYVGEGGGCLETVHG